MTKRRKLAEFARAPKYELVDPKSLKCDPSFVPDDYFVQLYKKFLNGRIVLVHTRLPIDRIQPGMLIRSSSGSIEANVQPIDPKHVEYISFDIRSGYRPVLCVYRGRFEGFRETFVCSDDLVAFFAYQSLGVTNVPVAILGKYPGLMPESAICVRVSNEGRGVFDRTIAAPRPAAQAMLGSRENLMRLDPYAAIAKLKAESIRAASMVKSFHIDREGDDAVHYHHTLHSIAYRLIETLDVCSLLLQKGFHFQIRPLVRAAYDMFLNFYIDWLYPEKVGPLLQALAALSRISEDDKSYLELKSAINRNYGGLANICGTAADKGRLSPFGEELHRKIYSSLSPVVHQDFGVTHEYGYTISEDRPAEMTKPELMTLVRWLDLIVTATIVRIFSDTGRPHLSSAETGGLAHLSAP